MAQLPEEYRNNQENSDEQSFDLLPAGDYIAIIESSDYVENKKGTGMMLKMTYQIIDGPKKGQKLFNNLNLQHKNKQAEQISRRTLNKINDICGFTEGKRAKDSSQLHGIPMLISVKVKGKETDDYGRQNSIEKHSPVKGEAKAEQATTESTTESTGKPKQAWED